MADDLYLINGSTLTGIADAIKGVKGTTANIQVKNFASEISSISAAPVYHTVTFKGLNNEILEVYRVEHGKNLIYTGKTPASTDSLFIGWSTTTNNVASDMTVMSYAGANSYGSANFTFVSGNKYNTLTQYNGSGSTLVIPCNIGGKSIVSIQNTCSFGSEITNITFPSSITNIGDNVFANCTNLKDIYYTGTKSQWFNMMCQSISTNLPFYTAARIHTLDGCIAN